MYNFSSFIVLTENSLDKEFCEHVIEKFEKDDRKQAGAVGPKREFNPALKLSTDLQITWLPEWVEEDGEFFRSLSEGMKHYASQKFLKDLTGEESEAGRFGILEEPLEDAGYQIQRTDPGGYYNWHQDWSHRRDMGSRMLTYIWYLNDVTQGGGYTEFLDGTMIYPKQGNLLIFPATWNYYHRGVPPVKDTKYIATGWMYLNYDKRNEQ